MAEVRMELSRIGAVLERTESQALGVLSALDAHWSTRVALDLFLDRNQQSDSATLQQAASAGPQGCAFAGVCCLYDDEDDPGQFLMMSMACGHTIHESCLRERLRTGCLGFSADGTLEKGSVAVIGAVCPQLDSMGRAHDHAGVPTCSEPIPWLELLDDR